MTLNDLKRYEKIRHNPDVVLAMSVRCEEERHDWEQGLTAVFRPVLICKWCGGRKP